MKVRRIVLRQFRNYAALDFTPSPGVNVLVGKNGQGKTNLLESLYLCCTGRSFRAGKEKEVLRYEGAENALPPFDETDRLQDTADSCLQDGNNCPQPVDKPVDNRGKELWTAPETGDKPVKTAYAAQGEGSGEPSNRDEIITNDAEEDEDRPTAPWALVQLEIEKMGAAYQLDYLIQKEKRHVIRINRTPIARIGELMGTLNCVLFSPEEMRILKEGPVERRRYMDILLSQLFPTYFFSLQRYTQALRQRNALLHLPNRGSAKNQAVLRALSEGMAQSGALVMQYRRYLAGEMETLARAQHAVLAPDEQLSLVYQPNVQTFAEARTTADTEETDDPLSAVSRQDIAKALFVALTTHTDAEMQRGTTLYGPHRDELQILLNGQSARLFASQGQQRTLLLSLKLAEVELYARMRGEKPILLFDDVFSELDEERQKLLFAQAQQTQTFITSAQLHALPLKTGSFFEVEKGAIRPFTP